MEGDFLRKLFNAANAVLKHRIRSLNQSEVSEYSKTLYRLQDYVTDSPREISIKRSFVDYLESELQKYCQQDKSKGLKYLSRVSDLRLHLFGSTVMKTLMLKGDLDISLNGLYKEPGDGPEFYLHEFKHNALHVNLLFDIRRWLMRRKILSGDAIVVKGAKVPILKFKDVYRGMECDINVGNFSGVARSAIISEILDLNPKIRILVILAKRWALVHSLNDASKRSFGSYALTVIVLSFSCEIGMLPPLLDLLPAFPEADEIDSQYKQICKHIRENGVRIETKESMLEILLSFFSFLWIYATREALYADKRPRIEVCCLSGASMVDLEHGDDRGCSLFVRDPFDIFSNCAHPVSPENLGKMSRLLQDHIKEISDFLSSDRESRKENWTRLTSSLFKKGLAVKNAKQQDESRLEPEYKSLGYGLLDLSDLLIEHYLKSGNPRVIASDHSQWFLEKYRSISQNEISREDLFH